MKVLWITNTIFPEFAIEIGTPPPVLGGWMYALADDLANSKQVSLHIATVSKKNKSAHVSKNNKNYHLISGSKNPKNYDTTLEPKWKKLIEEIKPDIVHIHGSEYAYGLSLMNSCPYLTYIVSIQGLISVYERYFFGGLKPFQILKNITIRDILKKDTLFQGKKEYRKRGKKIELNYFNKTKHAIGRTSWDKAHIKAINPDCEYHFCNESLRDNFYTSAKWSYDKMIPNTIFLSQATVPIKGLHQVLKALILVKKNFPDVILKIAGGNILGNDKLKLRRKGYGKLINDLIKKNNLTKNVEFTDYLNPNEMVEQYIKSNIFICPSSIENSPNSVGEAQIIGVPTIASYVGGIQNMIKNEHDGLIYRFEEVEMLAENINRIFTNQELAEKLSKNAIITAEKRHNRDSNLNQLINIYKKI